MDFNILRPMFYSLRQIPWVLGKDRKL